MAEPIAEHARKTSIEIYTWLRDAAPGSMYVYATCGALTDNGLVYRVGREMWALAVEGRVYLVRRRLPNHISTFEYIAIKASIPPIMSLVTKDYGDEPFFRGNPLVRPLRYGQRRPAIESKPESTENGERSSTVESK